MSRLKRLRDVKREPDLPPCQHPELVGMLFQAGPCETGGMGDVPLSASELMAWQQGSGERLTPWEFGLLRRLSSSYLGELQRASSPTRPAPWVKVGNAERRQDVARRLREVLRG